MLLAWSTPGAALVAATQGLSMEQAVGAFVLAGLLIAAMGLLRPLGRLVAMIPDAIAAGMLAGVLLPFVLRLAPSGPRGAGPGPPHARGLCPGAAAHPAWAVLAALALGLLLAFATGAAQAPQVPGPAPARPDRSPIRWSTAWASPCPSPSSPWRARTCPGFATHARRRAIDPPVGGALTATGLISAATGLSGPTRPTWPPSPPRSAWATTCTPTAAQRWKVGLAYAVVWVAPRASCPPSSSPPSPPCLPALVAGIVGIALLGPLTEP
jgi:benzoate membrane transport protein